MSKLGSDFKPDVLVIGGGVLGVCISYWLSAKYDCSILLVDKEPAVARHATGRNTGVIHRPFYLDPEAKKRFALTSVKSYPLWQELARSFGLRWRPSGTLDVALGDSDIPTLEKYARWGVENGMNENEMEIITPVVVAKLEPEVRCVGALHVKTDVSADFAEFTSCLLKLSIENGVKFIGGANVTSIRSDRHGPVCVELIHGDSIIKVTSKLVVNASGGGALELAHKLGLGRKYSSLNFRGEYWNVDEPFASKVSKSIYTPPRFPQFPFLDPHLVVRADGSRQIGPNAVLVSGPYVYSGVGLESAWRFVSSPILPKLRPFLDKEFIALLASEWRSSLSKKVMCQRVQKFIPRLDISMLARRAVFGVRSSVVDESGFVPEAFTLLAQGSIHVINYNSPGATGAPAFSAQVVAELEEEDYLSHLSMRDAPRVRGGWDPRAMAL